MLEPVRRIAALCLALAPAVAAQSPSGSLRLPFEIHTLPNGLTAILSVDRTTPTVAVNVWLGPDRLAIVVVGDRARVEGPLAAAGIALIALREIEGDPVSAP